MTQPFLDRTIFLAVSTGTGDFVVASAVTGFRTPATAGAVDTQVLHYAAQSTDLTQWEVGIGTYSTTGPTLARTTVLYNSLGTTAKINFTAAPQVLISALARDLGGSYLYYVGAGEILTFYVRKTGSDSNDGLTALTAWLTMDYAAHWVSRNVWIDGAAVGAYIDVDGGTFTETLHLGEVAGGGSVTFANNSGTRASAIFDGQAIGYGPGAWWFQEMKVQATAAVNAAALTSYGNGNSINIFGCDFGNINTGAILGCPSGGSQGNVTFQGDNNIIGTSAYLMTVDTGGYGEISHGSCTITTNPGWVAVINAARFGAVYASTTANFTFTNTAGYAGPKYLVTNNGALYCNDLSLLPGSAGTVDSSGRIVNNDVIFAPSFTGDSGSGGKIGYVPAPAAGDAAAGKYLKADGTYAVPPGTGVVTIGSTPIASGTSPRVLYEDSGNKVGEAQYFTILSGNVPNVAAGQAYYHDSVIALTSKGSTNWFVGGAGNQTGSGSNNSGFGASALAAFTTGSRNMAIGTSALTVNQDGVDNVGIGNTALASNVSGTGNVAIGSRALTSSTGNLNVAIGNDALLVNTDGASNVAVGYSALNNNVHGVFNVAVGQQALSTTGDRNVGVGQYAGAAITTGNGNVIIGPCPGSYGAVTSGSHNISIGYDVNVPTATADNQLVIGNYIYGTGLDSTGGTISGGKIGIGVKAPTWNLHVAGSLGCAEAGAILHSSATITGGGTGNVPTLTAGPVTGNPTKWLPYDDNGTTRYIPSW